MKPYNLKKGSPQWDFSQSRAKVQGMAGSFANGKSTAMIIKALRIVHDYPGCTGLLGRSTYPKLNDTLRKDFLRWCPESWIKRRPTKDDNSIYFNNDSVIHFRYVAQRGKTNEDGNTTSNLLSSTYDFIGIDQLEDPEFEYKDFLDLLGRLRGETSYKPKLRKGEKEDPTMPRTGPRWFMFGANPSRGWLFSKVVKPYHDWKERGTFSELLLVDEETNYPIMELVEADVYSNADNLSPDYIKTLEAAYKGQMRERFLLGKWAAFEGLVYPQFSEERNVLTRRQVQRHLSECVKRHVKLKVVEGYDFGNVSPTCYILAVVDDCGRVFIIDGFYHTEFPYDQHKSEIETIRSKYDWLKITDPICADPAIFRKNVVEKRSTGKSIADLLREDGLWLKPAQNDIGAGIAKVSTYWAGRADIAHPITGELNGPLLYVCDDLTWYTDEILNYFWKKNPQGDQIDEPMSRNDHAMDTTKYLLSYLPEASKVVLPKDALPPKWKFWHEVDDRMGV